MPKDVTGYVAYDGVALSDGSMDVRELAPALLAFGDLLQEANRSMNGGRTSLAVHVQSEFRRGSFTIELGLLMTLAQQASMAFSNDPIKTAQQIAEYVGLVSGQKVNLLTLLKWLKGRTPSAAVSVSTGQVTLSVSVDGDNNSITVSPQVYQLAQNVTVRKAVADTLKPLGDPGIDRMEVRDGIGPIVVVGKADVPSFVTPLPSAPSEDTGATSTRQTLLEVIKPSFQKDLKWVFSDGSGGKLNALVKDHIFNERVETGERAFAKGDVLRVALKSTPHITVEGRLETEHEVIQVLQEHFPPRQLTGLLPNPEPID